MSLRVERSETKHSPEVRFIARVGITSKANNDGKYFCSPTYLNQNQAQYDDWYCVVIFPSRSLEPSDKKTHRIFLNSDQVQRIYLKELDSPEQQPIGINLMQLTIASKKAIVKQARLLIERVQLEETDTEAKNKIIDIISTIAVYKFSSLTREEVEAMLGLSLEQTRVYQEAKAEGREEQKTEMLRAVVPLLLKTGMSVEQIAQQLNVDVEAVQSAAPQSA